MLLARLALEEKLLSVLPALMELIQKIPNTTGTTLMIKKSLALILAQILLTKMEPVTLALLALKDASLAQALI